MSETRPARCLQPLAEFPAADRRAIDTVLFDIDDTITLGGRIPARAYEAMERLHQAGIVVVPVTGRPAGWCDLIARLWPVDAVVGENGAFYFHYDTQARRMHRCFWYGAERRDRDRALLGAVAERILAAVPAARVAADQGYRESDLAIDYCEDVPRLPREHVRRIVREFENAGAVAKVSSIHVNGWFGEYDKRAMSTRLLSDLFGRDPEESVRTSVFVGDSPNDAPMFDLFPHSVGVANVRAFAAELTTAPRWVTLAPGGLGFAELVDALLAARA